MSYDTHAEGADMTDALMTAEITITDRDTVVAIGGPADQAEAMAVAMARRLGIAPAPAGTLLAFGLPAAELPPLAEWLKQNYPQIGFLPKPMPLAKAKSPWRSFRLAIDAEIPVDDTLVATIALVVDGLHEQVVSWHLDPEASIGAVVQDCEPMLHITVGPAKRIVHVAHLPSGTKLPTKLASSPYSAEPHH